MDETTDRLRIRELIENWVVWRDAGMWDAFRTVWADEGRMMATWMQGTADEFIAVNEEGWAKGVRILHFLGGSSIEVAGDRSIAQTKMTISQRGPVHGVEVDVVCTGRFYDFLDKRDGEWKLVLRQPIYEKDRMDPVDPSVTLDLDPAVLARFPSGYRTSPTCRTVSASRSRSTCRGSMEPRSSSFTQTGRRGWRVSR